MRIIASLEEIVDLIQKYANRQPMSEEETQLLEAWRARSAENYALPDHFRDPAWVLEQLIERKTVPSKEMWATICERIGTKTSPERPFSRLIL
jgi:hypothetical protein